MRSILITALLLIVIVGLYQALFSGDEGLVSELARHEDQASERIMRLNP